MKFSTLAESSFSRRETPGIFVFFAMTVGSICLAHYLKGPVMDHFALHGGSPGEDPPWYFITRDFAKSIGSSVALLLSVVVAAFTWRWWPTYSSMMVWMSVLWQGGDIAQGWIIYRYCPGLLNGQRNTSRWTTFKSYLCDAEIDQVRTYVLAGALLLAFTLPLADRYIRRKLKSKNSNGGKEPFPSLDPHP
jgi:hypothetical protein